MPADFKSKWGGGKNCGNRSHPSLGYRRRQSHRSPGGDSRGRRNQVLAAKEKSDAENRRERRPPQAACLISPKC